MSVKKPRKNLSAKKVEELLSYKQEDFTIQKVRELFAFNENNEQYMDPTDSFKLPKGTLYNKTDIYTTAGRYLFNKVILEPNLKDKLGYVNDVLDSGAQGDLNDRVTQLLMEDEITVEAYSDYVNKLSWIGYGLNDFLTQGLSLEIFEPIPNVIKRRDELFEQHKEAIEAGDVEVASRIESELVDLAQSQATELNGYEVFESGAGKKFSNNYKQVSILRGPILDSSNDTDWDISKHNLADGIPKEEYHIYAGLPLQGSYNRAIGTEKGGYLKKVLEASFQVEIIGEPGSDCGSKATLDVELTKGNIGKFKYRYIVEGQRLVLLDEENMKKYTGKRVKMRSPLYCTDEKFCSKCMGDHFHKLGIENVGMLTPSVGSSIMNSALKSFHDTTVKIYDVNIDDFIIEH